MIDHYQGRDSRLLKCLLLLSRTPDGIRSFQTSLREDEVNRHVVLVMCWPMLVLQLQRRWNASWLDFIYQTRPWKWLFGAPGLLVGVVHVALGRSWAAPGLLVARSCASSARA